MRVPGPDKNGNYVLRPSLLKMIPLWAIILFSVIIIIFSLISVFTGNYTDPNNNYFRIAMCTVIVGVSVFMIVKSPVYVITHDKVLLYGKWELFFSDIDQVVLHDNFIGMLEIKGKTETYSVFSLDVSCPLKIFSEILTERISVYEQRNS